MTSNPTWTFLPSLLTWEEDAVDPSSAAVDHLSGVVGPHRVGGEFFTGSDDEITTMAADDPNVAAATAAAITGGVFLPEGDLFILDGVDADTDGFVALIRSLKNHPVVPWSTVVFHESLLNGLDGLRATRKLGADRVGGHYWYTDATMMEVAELEE